MSSTTTWIILELIRRNRFKSRWSSLTGCEIGDLHPATPVEYIATVTAEPLVTGSHCWLLIDLWAEQQRPSSAPFTPITEPLFIHCALIIADYQAVPVHHNNSPNWIIFIPLCRSQKIKIPVFFLFLCKLYLTYVNAC